MSALLSELAQALPDTAPVPRDCSWVPTGIMLPLLLQGSG